MASATWMKDLEAAVVTAMLADPDLTVLCGVGGIEVGLMLPLKAQDIPQFQRPYIGVKAVGYSKGLGNIPGSAVGFSCHDVTIRMDIQHADAPQKTVEQRVKDILAQLAITIGGQRKANPFGLLSAKVVSFDLDCGSGLVSMVAAPDDETSSWVVEGEYVFTVRVRVALN